MRPKFQPGDKARIAPPRLRGYYPPSVTVGRVVTIKRLLPTPHGEKLYYEIGNNGRGGQRVFRSDDLRRLTEPSLRGGIRKGSGRKPRAPGGHCGDPQAV